MSTVELHPKERKRCSTTGRVVYPSPSLPQQVLSRRQIQIHAARFSIPVSSAPPPLQIQRAHRPGPGETPSRRRRRLGRPPARARRPDSSRSHGAAARREEGRRPRRGRCVRARARQRLSSVFLAPFLRCARVRLRLCVCVCVCPCARVCVCAQIRARSALDLARSGADPGVRRHCGWLIARLLGCCCRVLLTVPRHREGRRAAGGPRLPRPSARRAAVLPGVCLPNRVSPPSSPRDLQACANVNQNVVSHAFYLHL